MSTVTTYQSLHTDSFINLTMDFSILKQNFTTLNEFIKNFSQFQKKFLDLQKIQKAMNEDLSSFKVNTQSQFSTINQVLQSRSQITQGKSSAANEQLNQIRKSIKQLKTFMTQSTRQQHEAQQIRQKQQESLNTTYQQSIKQLKSKQSHTQIYTIQLQKKIQELNFVAAKKSSITEINFTLQAEKQRVSVLEQNINNVQKILRQTKVQEFKLIIDQIQKKTIEDLNDMKVKFNTKANGSDLLKLEEMILNLIDYSYQNSIKSFANKSQTKKALVFLEKRMNSLLVTVLGEEEGERQALLTAKQLKCISCTKDLGQLEGKLDKYKAWSIFPVKQSNTKEKYSGFGAGFQSIIQTTVAKKGGEVALDDKGRMVAPFNLTSTYQGSFMKTSRSQHKIQPNDKSVSKISPSKHSLKFQTNFMHQFGRQSKQSQINLINQYFLQYKGLQSFMITKGKTFDQRSRNHEQL